MAWKRKRGGQPKNRNAQTHGFYSTAMTEAVRKVFRRALDVDVESLATEIALLRTALHELTHAEKSNVEGLAVVARTLVRAVAVNHGLSKGQEEAINDCMVNLIRDLLPAAGGL